jgi:hypothetical protein
METELKLTNVGPIEGSFAVELQGPGLYELRGTKGTGKSSILSALDLLSGHKVDLTVHDGELSGSVEGFGVVAPIASRKKRRGELEVDVLDSERFELADLIDPAGKTPAVRDAARIKALASLAGVRSDPSVYYELVGGQEEFEQLGVSEAKDPVVLANRVKQALEGSARTLESVVDSESGHATACREAARGVDLGAPCDQQELGRAVEDAIGDLHRLQEQQRAGVEAQSALQLAREKLERAEKSYDGPSTEDAEFEMAKQKSTLDKCQQKVADLKAQLVEAEKQQLAQEHTVKAASDAIRLAKQHNEDIAGWKETVERPVVDVVDDEQVTKAREAVESAKDRMSDGVRVREAQAANARADEHAKQANRARKKAESLRSAAGSVFGVLARQVGADPITIESVDQEPRLVVRHPKRGKTLYDKVNGLSDGERVRYSIEALLPHVNSPGLFALPQRVYQDLPPADRAWLAEYAEEKGIFIFGAQVDDGQLSMHPYNHKEQ